MVVKFLAKKGLGLLGKKKKILTADKGAIRIEEINKKIRNAPRNIRKDIHEDHAQEVYDIYEGKWKGKK